MLKKIFFPGCFCLLLLSSCSVYRQNIAFRTKDYPLAKLSLAVAAAEKNYHIQPGDALDVQLYANKGEKLIDLYANPLPTNFAGVNTQAGSQNRFLVQENGKVRLPVVGEVYLKNYTITQADSVLVKAFLPFYEEPFVLTRYLNKRITVLGTNTSVVPLVNERMTVMEVLALSGGIRNDAKIQKIRLIRGNLNENPQVFLINLSTIGGMRDSQLQVESGDVLYIEPVRKIIPESLGDIYPILSLISTVVTTILVLRTLR
jgi:polysaccharide biosynthesis/export protein